LRLRAAFLLLALLPATARAAPIEDAMERARAHYEAGRALFSLGSYQEALREFTAGYQLAGKPRFLVNLGQTYRKLGQLEEARAMYRRFLDQVPRDDPDRTAVLTLLGEVEREMLLHPVRQTVAPSPSPVVVVAIKKPFIRRHWWIVPTVVVVAAGVAVGIYFGVRASQPDCASAGLGCVYP
jgi:tetratricopeptide (TPR) repeat protein